MPNFHLSQYQITCHYKTDNVPDVVISVVFHSHLFVHLDFNCSAKTTAIILRIAPQNYCSFVQLFYELFPIFLCCIGITGSPQCLLHRFTGGNIYGNIRTDLPAYRSYNVSVSILFRHKTIAILSRSSVLGFVRTPRSN